MTMYSVDVLTIGLIPDGDQRTILTRLLIEPRTRRQVTQHNESHPLPARRMISLPTCTLHELVIQSAL
jgi:hypothetical protein